nr:helix-turn-helix transcriptional regulator [uncultured Enterobacter sp.]
MTTMVNPLSTLLDCNKYKSYGCSYYEVPGEIQLVHCLDKYFEAGVMTLLNNIFSQRIADFLKLHNFSYLSVYVFSGENLAEVCNIMMSRPIVDYAIVFGDESVYRLLSNMYKSERVCFLSSHSGIVSVKNKLLRFFKSRDRKPVREVEMTNLETLVLSFLAKGRTPNQISRGFNLSIQSISRHKRNAMLKLGVRTTTELFLKHTLITAQRKLQTVIVINEMSPDR